MQFYKPARYPALPCRLEADLPCCRRGYDGDGKTCVANPTALQALTSLYWSEPQGLACDAGEDVAWPTSAPGEPAPIERARSSLLGRSGNVPMRLSPAPGPETA